MTWATKEGVKTSNYFGSVTQASTTQIGTNAAGAAVYVPLKNLLPMVNPNDLVIGGWDISKVCPAFADKAMCRECVESSQLLSAPCGAFGDGSCTSGTRCGAARCST